MGWRGFKVVSSVFQDISVVLQVDFRGSKRIRMCNKISEAFKGASEGFRFRVVL